MSFQQHVESHRQSQHCLKIETFVENEKLAAKLARIMTLKWQLVKAGWAFKKFTRANLCLDMAKMDVTHRMSPAKEARAQRRLRKAKKNYEMAKRGCQTLGGDVKS